MTLVFASSNKNKIKEIKALLPQPIHLLGLEEVGIHTEIPETGLTIKENSLIKANYVSNFLQESGKEKAVFADDSGLEVTALNNQPGVYSALYAGVPKNDVANNQKLLQELSSISKRNARFITVITLFINNQIHYFEGEIKGTIAYEARGDNGFGYDPLFIPQGYRSTFAELSAETKNTISHRGIATKKLVAFLLKEVKL
jgi:XTP/dITP diphosphohydrolase